ncbi:MAG: apolipoprotein A1/A4/E family protein [Muribaculaceae bacterium]|nr:apolipoprotein A1/A4/E family protein [Muribaculaceae bacterium]
MAENYSFFNSKDHDRKYNTRHWADYFLPLFKPGVFSGDLQVVENGGMTVKIEAGYAWIDGYGYHLTDGLVLDLETASGNMNRMDSVVIRLDLTNRYIKAFCKTGSYCAGTPTPPAPDITETLHEIVLAHIFVAAGVTEITQDMIADTRMDKDLCGWVCGTVEEIDFSQIKAQFDKFFANYKENIIAQYNTYLHDMGVMKTEAGTYYDDFAALTNEKYHGFLLDIETYINGLQETGDDRLEKVIEVLTVYETRMQAIFDEWFDNVREKLSEDAAGRLQNQIGQLPHLKTQTKENLVEAVNELYDRNLNTIEEIRDNTDPSKTVGALAFKEYLDGIGIPLAVPTGVSVTNKDEAVEVRWTDPQDIVNGVETAAAWEGTILIRKAGSPPTGKTDGVILLDSKTRDAYKTAGFVDNGLTNGETYYYGIFPYTTLKSYTCDCVKEITPEVIFPSAVSEVQITEENAKLTVTFAKDSTVTEVKCVYKTGSAPESAEDGTVITDFTSGASITGLVNDTTYYIRLYAYNAKRRETAGAAYSATPYTTKIVTFADGTDAEIAEMLEAHYADKINISDYWAVGDERVIHLSAMGAWKSGTKISHNGETHAAQDATFVILGFDHDDLATPINGHKKAAVSVQMKDTLKTLGIIDYDYRAYYVTNNKTYTRSWPECHRRVNWINSIFKNALPETIRREIKTVNKLTYVTKSTYSDGDWSQYYIRQSTYDDCYLLSCVEAGLGTNSSVYIGEGTRYEYYKTDSNRVKRKNNPNNSWMLRSAAYSSPSQWDYVNPGGGFYQTSPDVLAGIAPGFSL